MKPLAIDLFCGLGGWTEGLLAEGWDVVGFDIEPHQYGDHKYPAQLVIQDVLTLHGSQFKSAALIVASPPCQAYSYRAMPWSRAKALPPPDNTLFEACFRIQREACEAADRHIPLIVENVRGAQKWVGRARWNYGAFYPLGRFARAHASWQADQAGRRLVRRSAQRWRRRNLGKFWQQIACPQDGQRHDCEDSPAVVTAYRAGVRPMTIDVMSNATQLRAELERIARRAFMPKLFLQIWLNPPPREYRNPPPYEIERWADDGGRA